jgi:DNA-binding PadR family transcriptional regulator
MRPFDGEFWSMGRGARHAHGFGFGFGRGGRGFMGGDMPGGRKLSSSDLQLVLLALLEQHPSHGYELIKALEERSNGFYSPSPGVIYPALTYLEEIGRAAIEACGNRKLYRLTDEGREYLQTHRARVEAMLAALGRIGGRMQDVREAFVGLHDMDPKAADELHRARSALKHALLQARGCSHEQALRIAEILERAAAEIRRAR